MQQQNVHPGRGGRIAGLAAGLLVAAAAGPELSAQMVAESFGASPTLSASPGTLGTEVYRSSVINAVIGNGEDLEVADDLHLTSAGNLVSFDFTYGTQLVNGATSVTATVNFYATDPTDSLQPPAALLASFTIPNLPIGGAGVFFHTQTYDLVTPVPIPADVWVGVRVDLEGVESPFVPGQSNPDNWASVAIDQFGGAPALGFSHDIVYAGPPFGAVFAAPWRSALTVRTGNLPPANHPPQCFMSLADAQSMFLEVAPGEFVVTEGETFVVPVTGTDQDGDALTVTGAGLPPNAALGPLTGPSPLTTTLTYTAAAGDKPGAPYAVDVTFTDTVGGSTTCSVTVADVNLRPICDAGGGPGQQMVVPCDSTGGAFVTLNGTATDPDDPASALTYHWDVSDLSVILDDPASPTPSATFPVGVTMATLTVTDGRGGVDVCDVSVEVRDLVPPEVVATTDLASLWPPNHKMVDVQVVIAITDDCADPGSISPLSVTVRSDELDDAAGNGDGNTTGDVDGADAFSAPLNLTARMAYDAAQNCFLCTVPMRAERSSSGDGRSYIIDVVAEDSAGNSTTTSCVVVVPHDRRK